MNEEITNESPVKRILTALDPSKSSINSLHTAVESWPRGSGPKIRGIFAEDVKLLRLAQLPFAREINLYAPVMRQLAPGGMELQLRVQARRIRGMLAQRTEQPGVPWEFRTARGDVDAEVLFAGAVVNPPAWKTGSRKKSFAVLSI